MDWAVIKSGGLFAVTAILALTVYRLLDVFVFGKLKNNKDYKGLRAEILSVLSNDLELGKVSTLISNMNEILKNIDSTLKSVKDNTFDIKNIVVRIEDKLDKLGDKMDRLEKRMDQRFDYLIDKLT